LLEWLRTAAIAVLSSDFPSLPIADFLYLTFAHFSSFLSSGALPLVSSLFAMRAAARKCARLVSVSLILSVSISRLWLAKPSSGEELTPTMDAFNREATRKRAGDDDVDGGYTCIKRLMNPVAMGTACPSSIMHITLINLI
jgi:hypothetical protein